MDDLEEIRNRKEKRNAELDQILSDDDGKEKENTNAADGVHRAVIRHSFRKAAKVADEAMAGHGSSAKAPPPVTSVKSLRSRWEFSSVTGTPLHPDSQDDEILMTAVRLSQQRNKPVMGSSSSSYAPKAPSSCMDTPVRRFEKADLRATSSVSPRRFANKPSETNNKPNPSTPTATVPDKSPSHYAAKSPQLHTIGSPPKPATRTRTVSYSTEIDSPQRTIGSQPSSPIHPQSPAHDQTVGGIISSPVNKSPEARDLIDGTTTSTSSIHQINQPLAATSTSAFTFDITSKADAKFRPVTPTDEIIGSLWDDINSELEKYKQSKQYQSDPNLSPRSRYEASTTTDMGHSISSYRSQSAKRMGQPSIREDNQLGSPHGSNLPEKKQRAEVSLMEIDQPPKHQQIDDSQSEESSDNQSNSAQRSAVHNTTADQEAILKRLHDTIIIQQEQICQASRALAFCRQNDRFRGTREEVDAQRALLISTERRRALLQERDRVINGRYLTSGNDPRGTLTFSAMSIMLSREYITNYLQHPSASNRYYFIVLIKCGEHVFHTTLASSDQGIKSGFLEFSHYITITDLTPDFVCEIEIHSLKSTQENTGTDRSARSKKGTWRRMVISTPLNAYSNTFSSYSSSSAHRPIGVMDPGFQRIGHLTITRQTVHRQKYLFVDSAYPLEGTVLLNLDCHPDTNSLPVREYHSFLSLYQIVSGMGSWTRFWCSLGGGQLRFWRYPEDEMSKIPCVALDLSKCMSQVTVVPPSTASFPNSMQVDVMVVDERTNQKDGICMLFAADTPEERDHWMESINQAIRNSNVWRMMKKK